MAVQSSASALALVRNQYQPRAAASRRAMAVALDRHHQRLVDQPGQQVQHLVDGQAAGDGAGADPLHGLQGGPAGEHRQPPQQDLLVAAQQFPAPVDHGPQRLVAARDRPAAVGQEPEAVVQAGRDLPGGEGVEPGRGQLDGQRQAVQGTADAQHRAQGGLVHGEPWPGGRSPVGQQPHRRIGQRPGRGDLPVGDGQRPDRVQHLPGDPQRLAAGGQHRQARAAGEQVVDERGRRGHQVLAVVDHQQQPPVAERLHQPVQGRHGGGPRRRQQPQLARPERRQHGLGQVGRVDHRPKFDLPHPVGHPLKQAGRRLGGPPGLAGAARAGQGDQAGAGEGGRDPIQVVAAADEAR